jgi:hypothetical protein
MDARFFNVNRHGVLATPALFWLACLVLVRHWLLLVFLLVAARRSNEVMGLLGDGIPWSAMLGQVPGLFLLWAAGNRQPGALRGARWGWHHGAALAIITVVFNLLWAGWRWHTTAWDGERADLMLVCFSLLDFSIAWAFSRSNYYRQLFLEFPDAPSGSASK